MDRSIDLWHNQNTIIPDNNFAGSNDNENADFNFPTTVVSLCITQPSRLHIKTLQVLEICIKSQKKFSKDEHFWTFLKGNISLLMNPNLAINWKESISKDNCIDWLFKSKFTSSIETFKCIIQKLDENINGGLLYVKNTYRISCQLLTIFWYLEFKQMHQFIKVLQNKLGRSAWTFKSLSNVYIKNFRLKMKRKLLKSEPKTKLVVEFLSEPILWAHSKLVEIKLAQFVYWVFHCSWTIVSVCSCATSPCDLCDILQ